MFYVIRNKIAVYSGTQAECQLWIQANKKDFNDGDLLEIAQVLKTGNVSVNVVIN